MITAFVIKVSSFLSISPPTISKSQSPPRPTTLAWLVPAARTIYYQQPKSEPDLLFAIAHELRHLWQIESGIFPDDYKTSSMVGSFSYNRQPAEIDANAFAALVMESGFGLSPRFDGLSVEIKTMIDRRKEYLAAEGVIG